MISAGSPKAPSRARSATDSVYSSLELFPNGRRSLHNPGARASAECSRPSTRKPAKRMRPRRGPRRSKTGAQRPAPALHQRLHHHRGFSDSMPTSKRTPRMGHCRRHSAHSVGRDWRRSDDTGRSARSSAYRLDLAGEIVSSRAEHEHRLGHEVRRSIGLAESHAYMARWRCVAIEPVEENVTQALGEPQRDAGKFRCVASGDLRIHHLGEGRRRTDARRAARDLCPVRASPPSPRSRQGGPCAPGARRPPRSRSRRIWMAHEKSAPEIALEGADLDG